MSEIAVSFEDNLYKRGIDDIEFDSHLSTFFNTFNNKINDFNNQKIIDDPGFKYHNSNVHTTETDQLNLDIFKTSEFPLDRTDDLSLGSESESSFIKKFVPKRKKKFFKIHSNTRKFKIDCVNKKIKSNIFKFVRKFLNSISNLRLKRLDQKMIEKIDINFNKKLLNMKIIDIYKTYYAKDKRLNQNKFSKELMERMKTIENLEFLSLNVNHVSSVLNKTLTDFIKRHYINSYYYKNHLIKIRLISICEGPLQYYELYKFSSENFLNYFLESKGNIVLVEKKKKLKRGRRVNNCIRENKENNGDN